MPLDPNIILSGKIPTLGDAYLQFRRDQKVQETRDLQNQMYQQQIDKTNFDMEMKDNSIFVEDTLIPLLESNNQQGAIDALTQRKEELTQKGSAQAASKIDQAIKLTQQNPDMALRQAYNSRQRSIQAGFLPESQRTIVEVNGETMPAKKLKDGSVVDFKTGQPIPDAIEVRGQERSGYSIPKEVLIGDEVWLVPWETRNGGYWDYTKKVLSPKTPSGIRAASSAKEEGKITGKVTTEAAIDLPRMKSDADYLISVIDKALNHPGLEGSVGAWGFGKVASYVPGTKERDFMSIHNQITGKTFMEAYKTLKGGGQITEIEGQKATEALQRMQTATSEEAYRDAAEEFKSEIQRLLVIAEERAGKKKPASNDGWSIKEL